MSPSKRVVAKRKNKKLTLAEKMGILEQLNAGRSATDVARDYKMNESTVRTIRNNEGKLKFVDNKFSSSEQFLTQKQTVVREVEEELLRWLSYKANPQKLLSSYTIIHDKAVALYEELKGNCSSRFVASKTWYLKFLQRYKGSISTGSGVPRENMPHNHDPDPHSVALARGRVQDDDIPLSLLKTGMDLEDSTFSEESCFDSRHENESDTQSKDYNDPQFTRRYYNKAPEISMEPEVVCLQWNSHHSNMKSSLPKLLDNEQYVDCSLAADGTLIKCHKLVLSSCSTYFEEVFGRISELQHPVIFMNGVPLWVLKAIIEFMYIGEVHVEQIKLQELLDVAQTLQIKGLTKSLFQPEGSNLSNETETPKKRDVKEAFTSDPLLEPIYYEEEGRKEGVKRKIEVHSSKKSPSKKAKRWKTPSPVILRKGTKSRPNIKVPRQYHEYQSTDTAFTNEGKGESIIRETRSKDKHKNIEQPSENNSTTTTTIPDLLNVPIKTEKQDADESNMEEVTPSYENVQEANNRPNESEIVNSATVNVNINKEQDVNIEVDVEKMDEDVTHTRRSYESSAIKPKKERSEVDHLNNSELSAINPVPEELVETQLEVQAHSTPIKAVNTEEEKERGKVEVEKSKMQETQPYGIKLVNTEDLLESRNQVEHLNSQAPPVQSSSCSITPGNTQETEEEDDDDDDEEEDHEEEKINDELSDHSTANVESVNVQNTPKNLPKEPVEEVLQNDDEPKEPQEYSSYNQQSNSTIVEPQNTQNFDYNQEVRIVEPNQSQNIDEEMNYNQQSRIVEESNQAQLNYNQQSRIVEESNQAQNFEQLNYNQQSRIVEESNQSKNFEQLNYNQQSRIVEESNQSQNFDEQLNYSQQSTIVEPNRQNFDEQLNYNQQSSTQDFEELNYNQQSRIVEPVPQELYYDDIKELRSDQSRVLQPLNATITPELNTKREEKEEPRLIQQNTNIEPVNKKTLMSQLNKELKSKFSIHNLMKSVNNMDEDEDDEEEEDDDDDEEIDVESEEEEETTEPENEPSIQIQNLASSKPSLTIFPIGLPMFNKNNINPEEDDDDDEEEEEEGEQ